MLEGQDLITRNKCEAAAAVAQSALAGGGVLVDHGLSEPYVRTLHIVSIQ